MLRLRSRAALAFCFVLSSAAAGCAMPAPEDEGSQGDAIRAEKAAEDLGGSSRKLITGYGASHAATMVGVHHWTVYGVHTRDFQGVVAFGLDRDRDVKLALFSAKAAKAGTADVAIVNYDKKGPIAPTPRDGEVLRAVSSDLQRLGDTLGKQEQSRATANAVIECAASVTLGALVALAGAMAGAQIAAAAVVTSPAWVAAGIAGSGAAGLAGFVKVVAMFEAIPFAEATDKFTASCRRLG